MDRTALTVEAPMALARDDEPDPAPARVSFPITIPVDARAQVVAEVVRRQIGGRMPAGTAYVPADLIAACIDLAALHLSEGASLRDTLDPRYLPGLGPIEDARAQLHREIRHFLDCLMAAGFIAPVAP